MKLWLRTFASTLLHEMLAVILSLAVGIATLLSARAFVDRRPSLVLILGLIGCLIALTIWWRHASRFVSEPDPVIDDPRPFSARLAADMTTALVGVGVVVMCIAQIATMDELQTRWALLATILGGPFIALGLGAAWERWTKRTFG